MTDHDATTAAAAMVDEVLTTAGLPVSAEEREWLITYYPVLREMVSQLRVPEARYAEPALIYSSHAATRHELPENIALARLRQLDALLFGNAYSAETFVALLPHVSRYFQSLPQLRALELGEMTTFGVMLAGGER